MSLFKRIRDILDFGPAGIQRDEQARPLNLSEGQIQQLRGFVDSAEHDLLLEIIDTTIALYSESLLNADSEDLERLRSTILGLRIAGTLPWTIIQTLDKEDDLHARRALERSEQRARNLRTGTYGSPDWRSEFARSNGAD